MECVARTELIGHGPAHGSCDGLFNLGGARCRAGPAPPGVYVTMNGRVFGLGRTWWCSRGSGACPRERRSHPERRPCR